MMFLPQPIPLEEAAGLLGITDVGNPARVVRELIRRHEIPFVRCGRTVKLRPDQLRLLSEKMVECPSSSNEMKSPEFSMSPVPSQSGEMGNLIRLRSDDRPKSATKLKQTQSAGKSKTRSRSEISPVANPLSRSAQARKNT